MPAFAGMTRDGPGMTAWGWRGQKPTAQSKKVFWFFFAKKNRLLSLLLEF
jgi:hypothetical protein